MSLDWKLPERLVPAELYEEWLAKLGVGEGDVDSDLRAPILYIIQQHMLQNIKDDLAKTDAAVVEWVGTDGNTYVSNIDLSLYLLSQGKAKVVLHQKLLTTANEYYHFLSVCVKKISDVQLLLWIESAIVEQILPFISTLPEELDEESMVTARAIVECLLLTLNDLDGVHLATIFNLIVKHSGLYDMVVNFTTLKTVVECCCQNGIELDILPEFQHFLFLLDNKLAKEDDSIGDFIPPVASDNAANSDICQRLTLHYIDSIPHTWITTQNLSMFPTIIQLKLLTVARFEPIIVALADNGKVEIVRVIKLMTAVSKIANCEMRLELMSCIDLFIDVMRDSGHSVIAQLYQCGLLDSVTLIAKLQPNKPEEKPDVPNKVKGKKKPDLLLAFREALMLAEYAIDRADSPVLEAAMHYCHTLPIPLCQKMLEYDPKLAQRYADRFDENYVSYLMALPTNYLQDIGFKLAFELPTPLFGISACATSLLLLEAEESRYTAEYVLIHYSKMHRQTRNELFTREKLLGLLAKNDYSLPIADSELLEQYADTLLENDKCLQQLISGPSIELYLDQPEMLERICHRLIGKPVVHDDRESKAIEIDYGKLHKQIPWACHALVTHQCQSYTNAQIIALQHKYGNLCKRIVKTHLIEISSDPSKLLETIAQQLDRIKGLPKWKFTGLQGSDNGGVSRHVFDDIFTQLQSSGAFIEFKETDGNTYLFPVGDRHFSMPALCRLIVKAIVVDKVVPGLKLHPVICMAMAGVFETTYPSYDMLNWIVSDELLSIVAPKIRHTRNHTSLLAEVTARYPEHAKAITAFSQNASAMEILNPRLIERVVSGSVMQDQVTHVLSKFTCCSSNLTYKDASKQTDHSIGISYHTTFHDFLQKENLHGGDAKDDDDDEDETMNSGNKYALFVDTVDKNLVDKLFGMSPESLIAEADDTKDASGEEKKELDNELLSDDDDDDSDSNPEEDERLKPKKKAIMKVRTMARASSESEDDDQEVTNGDLTDDEALARALIVSMQDSVKLSSAEKSADEPKPATSKVNQLCWLDRITYVYFQAFRQVVRNLDDTQQYELLRFWFGSARGATLVENPKLNLCTKRPTNAFTAATCCYTMHMPICPDIDLSNAHVDYLSAVNRAAEWINELVAISLESQRRAEAANCSFQMG